MYAIDNDIKYRNDTIYHIIYARTDADMRQIYYETKTLHLGSVYAFQHGHVNIFHEFVKTERKMHCETIKNIIYMYSLYTIQ